MWPFKKKEKARSNWRDRLQKRLFSAVEKEEFWSKWGTSAESIDQIIKADLQSLVARSREQYANNDYVKRYVNLCQTNIVGENGISVQSTVKDRQGNSDTAVQAVLEDAYADFSLSVNTAGTLCRSEFESLIVQGCAIDGEVFVIRHVSKAFKYGVAFSTIDPMLCPVGYNDIDRNIIAGIQYDGMGRPSKYFFTTTKNQEYIEISADNCRHVFLSEWIGQKRGIPWVATSLGRLKTLEGYQNAALINARVGATKMGFFTTTGDSVYQGEQVDGGVISEAEPGTFEQLPDGVSIQDWDPKYPHEQYGEFVGDNLRGISVGFGVSHHSLTGDMTGVNYTSSRTALLDERDNWKRKQAWLISQITRWMYESVIMYGVDFAGITFNGSPLREQPEHYMKATYQGRRWAWVDPKKEIDAAREAIALRVKSRSSIIRDSGDDPATVWNEISREEQELDNLGISTDNQENSTDEAIGNTDAE